MFGEEAVYCRNIKNLGTTNNKSRTKLQRLKAFIKEWQQTNQSEGTTGVVGFLAWQSQALTVLLCTKGDMFNRNVWAHAEGLPQ